MKVGLYFGSFNPIHHGHLIIASHVVNTTETDQVWFVVSPQNPLKNTKSLLNEHHRKLLVELAVENDDRLRCSAIEFKLPRPSYTIDTLAYLSETYPQHTFHIIMGSDSFKNLPKWKNFQKILNDYPLFIYERPGFPVKQSELTGSIKKFDAPLLQISATFIRKLVSEKKSIRYLVPEVVCKEIEQQNFYA